MNLISELFNGYVSSLLHKNTDPTFIHAWSEKKPCNFVVPTN